MSLDPHYTNSRLAALYDLDSPWGEDTDFYLAVAGSEPLSIVDIGCGTGTLAGGLNAAGHRVTGVAPAQAMLDVAPKNPFAAEVVWQQARADSFQLDELCDLATMTGHAFQVLLSDSEIQGALMNIYRSLKEEGLLVFESRNPDLNWDEIWDTENIWQTREGEVRQIRTGFLRDGERISFRHSFEFNDETLVSDSVLRFASLPDIRRLLELTAFEVIEMLGNWRGKKFEPLDQEMIFIAQKKAPLV